MKTLCVLALLLVAGLASAQTNFVYVVNDNSAEVQAYWQSGLRIGGWIAAGVFGIWMVRVTVSGGPEKHEEES